MSASARRRGFFLSGAFEVARFKLELQFHLTIRRLFLQADKNHGIV
jgi:hypothetical protein